MNSRYKIIKKVSQWACAITASVIGISMASAMPYSSERCPAVKSIHYTQSGQFMSKAHGTAWTSSKQAALSPTPSIKFVAVTGIGRERDAHVICSYRVGNNYFNLQSKHSVVLEGKHWRAVSTRLFMCMKNQHCGFRHTS